MDGGAPRGTGGKDKSAGDMASFDRAAHDGGKENRVDEFIPARHAQRRP